MRSVLHHPAMPLRRLLPNSIMSCYMRRRGTYLMKGHASGSLTAGLSTLQPLYGTSLHPRRPWPMRNAAFGSNFKVDEAALHFLLKQPGSRICKDSLHDPHWIFTHHVVRAKISFGVAVLLPSGQLAELQAPTLGRAQLAALHYPDVSKDWFRFPLTLHLRLPHAGACD